MDLSNALTGIGAAVLEARHQAGVEEIIGEDGMPYCSKCREPLMLKLNISGPVAERLGSTRYVPRNCECMREMFAETAAIERKRKQAEKKAQMRKDNLKSEKYRNSTFSKDDGRCVKLRNACEKYVSKHKEMIESNMGIAFLGNNGSGKTFWASCIANALIDAEATVYMSTLTKLIHEMNANYGEERDIFERKIRNVDFLIIDDYGAERGTEYSLEQAFEIIDMRYNAGKPLIITANLTEEALKNPPNMNYGRSYSRVIEMCPLIIRVEGERRQDIAAEKRKALIEMLLKDE